MKDETLTRRARRRYSGRKNAPPKRGDPRREGLPGTFLVTKNTACVFGRWGGKSETPVSSVWAAYLGQHPAKDRKKLYADRSQIREEANQ